MVFYLDFEGNALDPEVVRLMTILEEEMKYFKFLGNYKHFDLTVKERYVYKCDNTCRRERQENGL